MIKFERKTNKKVTFKKKLFMWLIFWWHKSFSWVQIRLHAKFQFHRSFGSALEVLGGTKILLTSLENIICIHALY